MLCYAMHMEPQLRGISVSVLRENEALPMQCRTVSLHSQLCGGEACSARKACMLCGKNSAEKTAAFFLYAKPEPASFAVCSVAVTAPIFYHSQNPNLICLPATVFFKDTVCRLFYFIFLCFSKMNERNLEENGNFMGLFFLFILTDVRICDIIKQK